MRIVIWIPRRKNVREEINKTSCVADILLLSTRTVQLMSIHSEDFIIKKGDRIAQLLILPSGTFSFVESVDTAPAMEGSRNTDGFGSTNVPQ